MLGSWNSSLGILENKEDSSSLKLIQYLLQTCSLENIWETFIWYIGILRNVCEFYFQHEMWSLLI